MPLIRSAIKQRPNSFSFEAIGTLWTITHDIGAHIEPLVKQRIAEFDANYSRFRNDSWVSHISKKSGTYKLPGDAKKLLEFYELLNKVSHGAVSPLVGQTLSDLGYDSEYSLRFKQRTLAPEMFQVMQLGQTSLTLQQPVLLDVGAAGKGYLVDIIIKLLQSQGATEAVVDAGGDMRHYAVSDSATVTIALQHPTELELAIGTATISNAGICGSSIALRAWDNYHHIVDPRTAESPKHILANWVVADTAMLADGLTTALFFMLPHELTNHFEYEYAIVYSDYSLERSANFPGEFFSDENGSM